VNLIFRGAEGLDRTLKALTIAGDKTAIPLMWQTRMDALRVMDLQDEFELVALDFCVTFEVSPPSWQAPLCRFKLEDSGNATPGFSDSDTLESWRETIPVSVLDGDDVAQGSAQVELSGEILGDAADALAKLEQAMGEGASQVVISCAHLIRVDFSAAGSILNWVANQKASGCVIQFRNVNRIVAAFFGVIGIHEFARVVPRST
jgi:ABC-type transporter Mla MlaB component